MNASRTFRIAAYALAVFLAAHASVAFAALAAVGEGGKPLGTCPLKHTDVSVSIADQIAYVSVTQTFANPFRRKIEAVYTFPLAADAAVSEMMIVVGDRQILGRIKPRSEARRVYEQAKAVGHVAALLDQQRPNVFRQAVANIEPGKEIEVTIGYTQTLAYEGGTYGFVFPMVVGPRAAPQMPPFSTFGRPASPTPDALLPSRDEKTSPSAAPKDTREGHDISIHGWIDAGRPIRSVRGKLHEVTVYWRAADHSRATFELTRKKTIPNKDFVLEFSAASDRIGDAFLTHTDKRGGFFTLVLEPPGKVAPRQVCPRELIFVVDTSGSQTGFPLETSKAVMRRAVGQLRPRDKFNVIGFANETLNCWDAPIANTAANRDKALKFIEGLQAGGGTAIDEALTAALAGKHDAHRVRIVAFFSDGLVGNDLGVLDEVRRNADNTRVFVFGTGHSANRFLLDNMARLGRGQVDYVLGQEEAPRVARAFYESTDAPVLTDIEIDWGPLVDVVEVGEVCPRRIPDLFSHRPVVVKGCYKPQPADVRGTITLRGRSGEGEFSRAVEVTLPAEQPANAALAPEWARAKIAELTARDLRGVQTGKPRPEVEEAVTMLGVDYRLMTPFTSFVAVERSRITRGGLPVLVDVPVEVAGSLGSAVSPAGYGPVPLKLPRPMFCGTPRMIPPGLRLRPRKGPRKPRPPLVAPMNVFNAASEKPVTSSDDWPVIGELDMITDGDKRGVDGAMVELGPEVQWVQIDLGRAHAIFAVLVWRDHGRTLVYHDVIIRVADDKDFTKNVRTIFNNDHDNSSGLGIGKDWEYIETHEGLLVPTEGLKARYVRLYSNGSTSDGLNRYTEVEVYALPAK